MQLRLAQRWLARSIRSFIPNRTSRRASLPAMANPSMRFHGWLLPRVMQGLFLLRVVFQVVARVLQLLQSIAHDFRDIGFPKLLGLLDCIKQHSRKGRSAKSLVSLHVQFFSLSHDVSNALVGDRSVDNGVRYRRWPMNACKVLVSTPRAAR